METKSCGNKHAWCMKCRPDMRAKLSKPKVKYREDLPPCRNCGTCDSCLALVAPDGQKFCRQCGQVKRTDEFSVRNGRLRNRCKECQGSRQVRVRCDLCSNNFVRARGSSRRVCSGCSDKTVQCRACGSTFTRVGGPQMYCSDGCRVGAARRGRQARHQQIRLGVLSHYSGGSIRCNCCSEDTLMFLALDHINNDGNEHRRGMGGGQYWSWFAKNDYPEGFQVLCHNCNQGKRVNGGVCPHEEMNG